MKKIPFLISFLLIVQMASAQWNTIGWNPYLQRDTSGDSTFVLSAPSRIAIQNGVANWTPSTSSAASYLVYTALLTQAGTGAPVATVLENTLGGTVVWSYDSPGNFVATLSGAFTENKTTPISQRAQQTPTVVDEQAKWVSGHRLTDNTYLLLSGDPDNGATNGVITNCLIEIRVYP